MKKKISLLVVIILNFSVTKLNALTGESFKIPNPTKYESLEDIINVMTSLIRPLFLVTFAAMILWGAYTYLTARDNEDKVKSARSTIIAAIIGFVLAVFAPGIVDFVANFLGVEGLSIS